MVAGSTSLSSVATMLECGTATRAYPPARFARPKSLSSATTTWPGCMSRTPDPSAFTWAVTWVKISAWQATVRASPSGKVGGEGRGQRLASRCGGFGGASSGSCNRLTSGFLQEETQPGGRADQRTTHLVRREPNVLDASQSKLMPATDRTVAEYRQVRTHYCKPTKTGESPYLESEGSPVGPWPWRSQLQVRCPPHPRRGKLLRRRTAPSAGAHR